MRKVKMTVEYDGTDFAGFQTQADGIRTVQQTLAATIGNLTGAAPVVHAAGRTDSGVHALGQVVHFATESRLAADKIEHALNAMLPRDVSVRSVSDVGDGFHARFSAVRRTYLYLVLNRPARSAVWDRYSVHEPRTLDMAAMRRVGALLCGTHDYAAFANAGGDPGATTVRRVDRVWVRRPRSGALVVLEVSANAFLRSMVRNIAGALIDVGRGGAKPSDIVAVLESRDRTRNPWPTAPARGLCLSKVVYEIDPADAVRSTGSGIGLERAIDEDS